MLYRILFVGLMLLRAGDLVAQDDFCDALTTIAADAPNRFHNVKGNQTADNFSASTWNSSIKLPGVIRSRFVASMGLFYEGAFYQSRAKDSLRPVYEEYKEKVAACLTPLGYGMSLNPNFSAGVEDFKKVVFIKEPTADVTPDKAPAHVTLEALYNKDIGLYTIVLYVFEH